MRTLPQLVAVAVIIASGVVHGLWTGRWTKSRVLEARVATLARVPTRIGDWEGRDLALDRRAVEHAEIAGYLMRRYENRRDGGAVTVLLVCGRPGPIAVHTPEVCFVGAGYETLTPRVRLRLTEGAGQEDGLWALDLGRPGPALAERLRVLYGWSTDGTWKASQAPRWDFSDAPALFKLYIVRSTDGAETPDSEDPGARFARLFLAELRASLFASR